MTTRIAKHLSPEAPLSLIDFDEPVDAWRLDELEQLSDLDSVRSALGRAENPES